MKSFLINAIHNEVPELTVKNLLIFERSKLTYAWFTFSPETAALTPRLLNQITKIMAVIKEKVAIVWDDDEDELDQIKLNKIDVAMDMKGGFIPVIQGRTFEQIRKRLQVAVGLIFGDRETNFLCPSSVRNLTVEEGVNILDTCWQYEVWNKDEERLLNIKIYDKFIDLVARDHFFMIGSRTANIIGSKLHIDSFNKKLRHAKLSGMARLEISICKAAIENYKFYMTPERTLWHQKMQKIMEFLIDDILNNKNIISIIYRSLHVPTLLELLGRSKENLLIIGTQNSWLINARTTSDRRFVGTRRAFGLTPLANSQLIWQKLEAFAQRFTAPGARVKVYCLHEQVSVPKCVTIFKKLKGKAYQLPGCNLPF